MTLRHVEYVASSADRGFRYVKPTQYTRVTGLCPTEHSRQATIKTPPFQTTTWSGRTSSWRYGATLSIPRSAGCGRRGGHAVAVSRRVRPRPRLRDDAVVSSECGDADGRSRAPDTLSALEPSSPS
ncbi:hypothetical protein C8039_15200 [Halogeometricum sp. wsp3]|nr:hypothetical protein C8039_15200 [Halogeometricum sp. wsp3]